MNTVVHSSQSVMWETPQWLFDEYNRLYKFNTDVCAIAENAKCDHYFCPEVDGLKQVWEGACWMNPPYGRGITGQWVEKAYNESKGGTTVVALLPARTDTRWFHQFIYKQPGVELIFLKGRLKFGNSINGAPFPSMIVIFKTCNNG
jgi:phage N-6-adenine-methyltransferase